MDVLFCNNFPRYASNFDFFVPAEQRRATASTLSEDTGLHSSHVLCSILPNTDCIVTSRSCPSIYLFYPTAWSPKAKVYIFHLGDSVG
jgi:hypothetical protein